VLLIIDISKHGAKEMGHVKMVGPGFVTDEWFVNDATAWWPGFVPKNYEQTGTKAFIFSGITLKLWLL
jgi:hypothetical protein